MSGFINKGLPDQDNISIFGLGDIQLLKSKSERAIILMNRVFAHNFLVKLPHGILLSQDKTTILSKEQIESLKYESFMKKMDKINLALVNCSLSEAPVQMASTEAELQADVVHDLLTRERLQYQGLIDLVDSSIKEVMEVVQGKIVETEITR